jgi:O-antigen/teichoic acid export membrane protein
MGIAGVLLGTLTGVVAAGIPAWYLTRGMFAFTFSRSRCIQLLKFSLPLVPSSVAVILTAQISRLSIDHFLTRDAVGIYGIAARIGSMITLVMTGFQNALAPLVFARHAEKDTPGDLAKIFRIFAVAALAGTAGFILFSREVLHVMTTPDYAGALPAVMILAPSALLAQMYVFAPGAWIAKRTWWITGVNVCAAVLSVGLNWTLIPVAGLQGAAWASLASALVSFALNMLISQRLYPVPHHWGRMAVAFGGTALCVACGLSFGGVAPWTGMVARLVALAAAILWIWRILGLPLRLRPVDPAPVS